MSHSSQLAAQLADRVEGQVLFDSFDCGRYATDASIYQMQPLGVVLPRSVEDLQATIAVCQREGVPLLSRGGGTSQCGQTVNRALVLDHSRYLNQLLKLDVAGRRCVVQPGMVLDELNRLLKPHGLWFPVDVSTASRATIGGMAANNSCGQRSLYYGTMRDNVHSVRALLANGEAMHFGQVPSTEHNRIQPAARATTQSELFANLLEIGSRYEPQVAARFPKLLRRVGGYNLDALSGPEDHRNMAHLLVGSEGTLSISTEIELTLAPLPRHKVLGVCHFPTFYQAMDAAQHLVALAPSAVELVDATMIDLAREIDIYSDTVAQFVNGEPAAVLIVEFAFDDQTENLRHLKRLEQCMADLGFDWRASGQQWGGVVAAVEPALQSAINEVRKAGLNIMMSMKSEGKPVSFVEDCAVDLPDLAEYTQGLTEIFARHGTRGTWYAHASVGCLHVRPVLNLKLEKDVATMREIAEQAFDLVLQYKGSHSGEHGDGISRSEFHKKMFGEEIVRGFEEIKACFDPSNLLNPGKIVNAPRMNDRSLLRYMPDYQAVEFSNKLQWAGFSGAGGGFQGAIEMCNNNGACRKLHGGGMCPSYRVTRNERDVTRGRANSLRLALTGQLGDDALTSDQMQESLRLCVSCKACKRECPTGVDMAKMKLEVMAARASVIGLSWHDRLVVALPRLAPFAARVPRLANTLGDWARLPIFKPLYERLSGFSNQRALPRFHVNPFTETDSCGESSREVVLLCDTFNRWFEPHNLRAARRVLQACGYRVHIAVGGKKTLCCGRTSLACGQLDMARTQARELQAAILPWIEKQIPVIGLEPSCLLTLRDEHLSLLPGAQSETIAANSWLLEEFISHEHAAGHFTASFKALDQKVLLHGHCHQKAFGVMTAVQKTLALIPGLDIETVQTACCGMAGTFGYASDSQEISRRMAELDLLPAVRHSDARTLIVADGTSCRHQIDSLAKRQAIHVACVLEMALPDSAHQ